MLGLPQSTEVRKPLPKAALYKQYGWNTAQREAFDAVVSRIDFVNWIAPKTLPAITEGTEVKAIIVAEVALKTRDFDIKPITLLTKSIPQRIIYILRFGEEMKLAVWHDKFFITDWQPLTTNYSLLTGMTLDAVWQNIVSNIGAFEVSQDNTLTEQIHLDDERNKLLRQIEMLERKMRQTTQPRRKREIFLELQKLTQLLN